jgi:2-hydroxycyclohexanecarboxyl-CoA dehydrogenase
VSRVAAVTGGASGIGLGVARRFAADGHLGGMYIRDI